MEETSTSYNTVSPLQQSACSASPTCFGPQVATNEFERDKARVDRKWWREDSQICSTRHAAKKLYKCALKAVVGTSLDKGEELDALAKLPPARHRLLARGPANGSRSNKPSSGKPAPQTAATRG